VGSERDDLRAAARGERRREVGIWPEMTWEQIATGPENGVS
jgi:hypothetical protein